MRAAVRGSLVAVISALASCGEQPPPPQDTGTSGGLTGGSPLTTAGAGSGGTGASGSSASGGGPGAGGGAGGGGGGPPPATPCWLNSGNPAPAGTPCPDANPCNGAETCDGAGVCIAGAPLALDDANPCTVDACAPSTGVSHTPAPAGMPCADTNPCNGTETCDGSGACALVVPPAIDDLDPCTFDACEPALGITHTSCAPLDLTTATTLGDALAFVWSGPDPVQTGVIPGAIEVHRAAAIRGVAPGWMARRCPGSQSRSRITPSTEARRPSPMAAS